ncbi:cytochrome bd-I ubiquinol oxidase subunit 2 apoprotein [Pseudovibrio denitrificans]|uniref:Cytochrome bd-I ubiquinol oxidase subunit 2 apoprotein n=2 Tax=Pseudovibrio TaxID=258255 RepID=A0A1I7C1X3_9HYPH|nr:MULTISPECIES: cytochrome d ubiquinol oxidase subunit II [Pseudovibrio]QUS56766.1 cytochrome d ubiquinol oxidase subunit II [Pseudovibrio brasiliensis]SFT93442.1 cytochrome bd-I ubiquinol oxidase subunit 2 apoprotein [Pseudovibrio denitrificans]
MMLDYPLIWGFLIAVAIFAYVVLDGFDLGIGILYPTTKDADERTLMMNSVAPVWDGNETWLILGGGGLFAVFPLAYSVIMPAVYAPIIGMLIGLIFRGVAFEFRFKSSVERRPFWDLSFFAGSIVAAFCQGLVLGTLVQGIEVVDRTYAGGWWDWLTPFSVMTGFAVVSGYALLGSTWLVMKLEGVPQAHFRRVSKYAALLLIAFLLLVSIWMPFINESIMEKWFSFPYLLYTFPVPLLVAITTLILWRALMSDADYTPFLASLVLFLLTYVGLGINIFPYVVPHVYTLWEAAAPDSSLKFLLVGAVILIPMILAYTAYAYYVFRGKIKSTEGYH